MATITVDRESAIIEAVPKQLYIAGSWQDGSQGTFVIEDPSTGDALCEVADATADDATQALDAAVEAGPAFEKIIERIDDLALINTLEMGKPVREAKAEIVYAAEFFRWFSEEAVRIDGRYTEHSNGDGRVLTMKQPIGT